MEGSGEYSGTRHLLVLVGSVGQMQHQAMRQDVQGKHDLQYVCSGRGVYLVKVQVVA